MLDKNALAQLRQLKQQIVESKPVLDGVIRGTQWRYGFVLLDDGKQLLVPGDEMNKVFPGDRVSIEIRQDDKGKDVAFIDKLLESNFKRLTGQIITKGNNNFVSPDVQNLSRWLFIPPAQLQGAKAGDYVEASVLKHPFRNEGKAQVKIERVIGAADERGIERTYTISKFQLDGRFPEGVIESLPALCAERLQHTEGRENLDDVFFVTIDGEESRDLDDALYVEANANGWRLLVAIADAAHFVTPNSDIDRIAKKRGTSTYLPGRVLPMLPEALSNEACSLLEGQQRLVVVCEMQIDREGVTTSQRIFEATIISRKRLSYESAQELLDKADSSDAATAQLLTLNALRAALFARRRSQYLAMEERPDFKLETDIDGRLTAIKRIDRNDAHRIIEECMLVANRAACDFLLEHKLPALFIAHAGFRSERHENVRQLISSQYPDKKDIAFNELAGYIELIRHIEQNPTDVPVYTLLSRQLERSQIALAPAPHFGMGLPFYSTFTSPIRKYHDLTIHRIIKAFLKAKQEKAFAIDAMVTEQLTQQLQEAIQRAKQSSRELEQWLKCIYLKPYAGKNFKGEIMQIGSRNIGVYLDEFDCNGHIDIKTLNDKFQFDAVVSELRCGERVFRLHQRVDVTLVDVDTTTRQITLQLVTAQQ